MRDNVAEKGPFLVRYNTSEGILAMKYQNILVRITDTLHKSGGEGNCEKTVLLPRKVGGVRSLTLSSIARLSPFSLYLARSGSNPKGRRIPTPKISSLRSSYAFIASETDIRHLPSMTEMSLS